MEFSLPASITQSLPADGPTAGLSWTPSPVDKAKRAAFAAAGAIPSQVTGLLAQPPVRADGARLDPFFQLGDKLIDLFGDKPLSEETMEYSRQQTVANVYACTGPEVPLPYVQDLSIPVTSDSEGSEAVIGARLYRPTTSDETLPLLMYIHGGGFAAGNLDTHDMTCRYISSHGELAVLSIDYRLAPEHRFPIPLDDCVAAFEWAHAHAEDLAIDPDKIAIGGDSAGGNLTLTTSLRLLEAGGPKNAFQLVFVPVTLVGGYGPSFAKFAEGPFLTREHIDFFEGAYLGDGADKDSPFVSPALSEDLGKLPPAHIAVAGFDPLRDQGELLARKMQEAGAKVSFRRHPTLIHPFANTVGVSDVARSAVDEAIGALRQGLGY